MFIYFREVQLAMSVEVLGRLLGSHERGIVFSIFHESAQRSPLHRLEVGVFVAFLFVEIILVVLPHILIALPTCTPFLHFTHPSLQVPLAAALCQWLVDGNGWIVFDLYICTVERKGG